MKKVRLTESDLHRIVKKVIEEQSLTDDMASLVHSKIKDAFAGVKKPKVLFVGDSQTADDESYAYQLLRSGKLHKDSQNKAVWGKKTDEIMKQLNSALNSGIKFDIINIMGGGNNAGDKDEGSQAKSDLQSMYNIAKKHGAIVVAISNPNKNWTKKDIKVKKTNNKIADFVNKKPSNTDIIINANEFKVNAYKKDRVHLNAIANTALKNHWVKKVLPVFYGQT